ncbi:MAG: PQQ-dependent sugar dehydrogenase [Deltaproteobacteria bacterium]|nr:PQQ-dependent sugar dehydrogenase [Deltaproteobacteria bacterium]
MYRWMMGGVFVFAIITMIGCSNNQASDPLQTTENPTPTPSPTSPPPPTVTPEDTVIGIKFTEVGDEFSAPMLVDLEFLPGTNGELITISLDGNIYYLTSDFKILSQSQNLVVGLEFEQGLLNVVADPDYATNHYIYLFYTTVGNQPVDQENRVDRFTVSVDVSAGTFNLADQQNIIRLPKSENPEPGTNHNGGGLFFNEAGQLFIAAGDAGGSGSANPTYAIAQNTELSLGKIHRVIPNHNSGQGGFTIPSGNIASTNYPSIYAYGLRNPFTITYHPGHLFMGDVGGGFYEEIDLAMSGGLNFGWPFTEGPTNDPQYVTPIGGYSHEDTTQEEEDPAEDPEMHAHSIMVGHFYTGSQYGNFLDNVLIYSEFYEGWVRGLTLEPMTGAVLNDRHLAHLAGMTSVQMGPDEFLYAVSLGESARILRIDPILQ